VLCKGDSLEGLEGATLNHSLHAFFLCSTGKMAYLIKSMCVYRTIVKFCAARPQPTPGTPTPTNTVRKKTDKKGASK
jgi:hypothetical protein